MNLDAVKLHIDLIDCLIIMALKYTLLEVSQRTITPLTIRQQKRYPERPQLSGILEQVRLSYSFTEICPSGGRPQQ
jgi:hypothetical protein